MYHPNLADQNNSVANNDKKDSELEKQKNSLGQIKKIIGSSRTIMPNSNFQEEDLEVLDECLNGCWKVIYNFKYENSNDDTYKHF